MQHSFSKVAHPVTTQPASPVHKPRSKAKIKNKPVQKTKTAVVTKKSTDYSIVTDNMYPIPKALDVDNDMTTVSLTPVAYTDQNTATKSTSSVPS
ncbi:hypothetical protein [uncultured Fibrobacter sp.]|uniref:hypothetical protein n=1 Tax=uncultured Fibrobacter sp. TaxID=261512 RepID=UPI00262E1638|nr:hypothetical protein [uncultured Fibrobacter sp.]